MKLFEFTRSGEIRDQPAIAGVEGECAVDDPGAPARCAAGPLKLNLPGWWDAAHELTDASE